MGLYDRSLCPVPPDSYAGTTMNISLAAGGKYGELIDLNTGERGNSFTGLQRDGEFARVIFDANGEIALTTDTIGLYVSTSDPNISAVEWRFLIGPSPIVVTINPSNISSGDTADIILKKRNPDGSIEEFPTEQVFEVGIINGCMKGEILTSVGKDTYFRDILPPFKFVAADSVDTTDSKIKIRVGMYIDQGGMAGSIKDGKIGTTQDSLKMKKQSALSRLKNITPNLLVRGNKKLPAKLASLEFCNLETFHYNDFGVGEVKVGKKKLKILDHSPWTIWPYLPPENISHRSRGADRPGYKSWRSFTIQVSDCNDKPLGDEGVTILAQFTEGSGGHQHSYTNAHRVLDNDKYGYFFGQGGKGPKTLDLITQSDGKALVDSFTQSQFSGSYLIKAYLKSDPSVFDTVNLNIQVPQLIHFTDIIILPTYYPDLDITKLDKYYNPWGQTDLGTANHPNNLWCTAEMGDNLLYVILSFYDWSESEEGGGIPLTLSLNDMSLLWGGSFDINGQWGVAKDHSLHRVGKSIDINYHNPELMKTEKNPQDTTKSIGILTKSGKKLNSFFNLNKRFDHISEPYSLHFEFNGNK